jgi:hypothetical protein
VDVRVRAFHVLTISIEKRQRSRSRKSSREGERERESVCVCVSLGVTVLTLSERTTNTLSCANEQLFEQLFKSYVFGERRV